MKLLFFAQLALAQTVSGQGCETVGDEIFCPPAEASDPFFGGGHMAGFRNRVEAARKKLREKEEKNRAIEASRLTLRMKIGEMIASGNCKGGYEEALKTGDFALALEVKSLCTPPLVPTE